MSLRDESRAQSIQIGAVLLFAVLIILLATYQAFVVPNQNREIEAGHVDTVTQQMQDLRNAIVSMPSSQAGRSITLTLGVEYPSRIVAVNPPTPTGALRTVGTTDSSINLTVANAVATDGEVDDRWNGQNRTFDTGGITYQPGYNEYRNPPTIVYENSLLYHRFRSGTLTRSGQRLVDGRQLTLVSLNGSMDRSASDSVAIDLQAVSASSRQIAVTNATGEVVSVDVASRYNASQWEAELREDGEFTDQGGYVRDVTDSPIPDSPFRVVHVELAGDEVYTLQMAKVGAGTGVESESVRYLTDVAGDGASIPEDSPTRVVLEARDALNNPVSGVEVHGRVGSGGGSLTDQTVRTDQDGQAVFEYQAGSVSGSSHEQSRLDFGYAGAPDADFDADAPENVSVSITVQNADSGGGGGGGAYDLFWADTSATGVSCDSASQPERCTLDASQTPDIDLTAATDPTAESAPLSYAVSDSTVGTLDTYTSSTDSAGEDTRTMTAAANGTVTVYTASGGSGDRIDVEVVNFGTGSGGNAPVVTSMSVSDRSNPGQGPRFDVSWAVSDNDGDLSEVEISMIEDTIFGDFTRDSETVSVSGLSGSGTTTLQYRVGDCGDEFTMEVTVTDQAGQTDTETRTVTASC